MLKNTIWALLEGSCLQNLSPYWWAVIIPVKITLNSAELTKVVRVCVCTIEALNTVQ